jgi:hypothetical protein
MPSRNNHMTHLIVNKEDFGPCPHEDGMWSQNLVQHGKEYFPDMCVYLWCIMLISWQPADIVKHCISTDCLHILNWFE